MTACCEPPALDPNSDDALLRRQRRVLWIVLWVNGTMFGVEMVSSWLAGSTALLADAIDFLADAATYGLTLYVLTKSVQWKAGATLAKGLAMAVFGLWVIAIALWRATDPVLPDAGIMGSIGVLALTANVGAALLLYWHRGDDLNMRSVWLCSRNDAIANVLVLAAAGAVAITATAWPDLIVGALIAALELSAAYTIIRAALPALRDARSK
ncbi:MAG: cation transporter [Alphaproteobacteria bacterium]